MPYIEVGASSTLIERCCSNGHDNALGDADGSPCNDPALDAAQVNTGPCPALSQPRHFSTTVCSTE
jgi:hypothetical protein